jgi:hypothetical protein
MSLLNTDFQFAVEDSHAWIHYKQQPTVLQQQPVAVDAESTNAGVSISSKLLKLEQSSNALTALLSKSSGRSHGSAYDSNNADADNCNRSEFPPSMGSGSGSNRHRSASTACSERSVDTVLSDDDADNNNNSGGGEERIKPTGNLLTWALETHSTQLVQTLLNPASSQLVSSSANSSYHVHWQYALCFRSTSLGSPLALAIEQYQYSKCSRAALAMMWQLLLNGWHYDVDITTAAAISTHALNGSKTGTKDEQQYQQQLQLEQLQQQPLDELAISDLVCMISNCPSLTASLFKVIQLVYTCSFVLLVL